MISSDKLQNRRISYLTEDVRKLITAGQVIRKPCDVVKELFENSIDAGADNIKIYLEDGGFKKVIVEDNGCGFHTDDRDLIARQSFSSKVKSLDDAQNIQSFGFRGEALAAMASTGKVSIISRRHEVENGIILEINHGNRNIYDESNLNPGTKIEVTDVFNKPTKKEIQDSINKITNLIKSYMILNINYNIVLYASKTVTRTPEITGNSMIEWLKHIYQTDFTSVELNNEYAEIKIYYGQPTKWKNNEYIYFVNRRFVKLKEITTKLNNFITSIIEGPPFTLFIFDIYTPPAFVDVHVDPQKLSVCLRENVEIINIIMDYFYSNYESYLESKKLLLPKNNTSINDSLNRSNINISFTSQRTSIDPTQIIRADYTQRSIRDFVNSSTRNIDESISNKVHAFIPVIKKQSNDKFLIQGYHRIVLSSNVPENGTYFPYVIKGSIPQVLCHRLVKKDNEYLYHEALLESHLLFNELSIVEKIPDDNLFAFKMTREIILNEIKKTPEEILHLVRNAANIELSVFKGEYHVFFQCDDGFNVVPFMNILHEYIVQIFIEKLGEFDMIINEGDTNKFKFNYLFNNSNERRSWNNMKTCASFLCEAFSLKVNYITSEDDVELIGVPNIQINEKVSIPFISFLHSIDRIPCLLKEKTHPIFIRQWIWITANEIAFSITSYIGNKSTIEHIWTEDMLRSLFKKYYPGKLFIKSLMHATTKEMYKIFDRC